MPWLIFDGDCAFCTSSAQWLALRLRRARGPNARLVPWQFAGSSPRSGQPRSVPSARLSWVAMDGGIHGGAAAFAKWLEFRGGAYRVAGRLMDLPFVRKQAAAVYRLIAKNRHRMPGGSPACALPPPGFDPAEPGTKRSNGANASQQIAVGAKWM